jgi:hypothetical protein
VSKFRRFWKRTAWTKKLLAAVQFRIPDVPFYVHYYLFLFDGSTVLVFLGFLIVEVSGSHWDTSHSARFLWASDRPVAETSTWEHIKDRYPCARRRSNPRYQQASGCRPTPDTTRLQGSAVGILLNYISFLCVRKTCSFFLEWKYVLKVLACFWPVKPIVIRVCCWCFWERQCSLLHFRTWSQIWMERVLPKRRQALLHTLPANKSRISVSQVHSKHLRWMPLEYQEHWGSGSLDEFWIWKKSKTRQTGVAY